MDEQKALEWIDQLIFTQFGKHLNDLEREVLLGSLEGKNYQEIHPLNPEYVEKYVGYKLWQKISQVLGEKVTKKTIRGALDRRRKQSSDPLTLEPKPDANQTQRVLIFYPSHEPDSSLAFTFRDAFQAAGHQVVTIPLGAVAPTHPQRDADSLSQIDAALAQCDYFLLLLSPQATLSEMVIEVLRQAKELQDSHERTKPIVLPIWINCPPNLSLNHDLRSYLNGLYQREWKSSLDTTAIIQEILTFLTSTPQRLPFSASLEWKLIGTEDWERDIQASNPENTPFLNFTAEESVNSKIPSPLPVAEPELPQGQVRLASAFYVKRIPEEDQCYQEMTHPGALIRIKAPRQMGKTSLMARILDQAREQGYRTVALSFQHADKAVFTNLNYLLRWFCAKVARKLRLPYQVDEYWTDTFGSKDNCTAFFEDCLLPETETPLVLGLDEVDRVFQYPKIADDFFSLLRAWYEEAGYGDGDSYAWEKLRLVIVHSTEVYIPLDINQSPFNVGLPIELSEFSPEQVTDLAYRHGLNWNPTQIQTLMQIIGGHPYLVRVAFYHIVQHHLTLEQLAEIAPTEAGIYGDHLRRHLWNLKQHPELAQALHQVVTANKPVELDSILAFKLHSMGLVHLQGNEIRLRFQLYRDYFSSRLVDLIAKSN